MMTTDLDTTGPGTRNFSTRDGTLDGILGLLHDVHVVYLAEPAAVVRRDAANDSIGLHWFVV